MSPVSYNPETTSCFQLRFLFGNCDALEQHGFASGKSYVDLLLKPAEEDLKYWPQGNRLFKEGKYELAKAKYDQVCYVR